VDRIIRQCLLPARRGNIGLPVVVEELVGRVYRVRRDDLHRQRCRANAAGAVNSRQRMDLSAAGAGLENVCHWLPAIVPPCGRDENSAKQAVNVAAPRGSPRRQSACGSRASSTQGQSQVTAAGAAATCRGRARLTPDRRSQVGTDVDWLSAYGAHKVGGRLALREGATSGR